MTTERIQLDPSMGGRSVSYVNVPEARHRLHCVVDYGGFKDDWRTTGHGTAKQALADLAERRKKHNPVIDGLTITYGRPGGIKYRITYEDVTE